MAKTLYGYVGGVYKPTKGAQAFVGGVWNPAKSVQRFTNGAWISALETTVTVINDGTASAPHLTAQPAIPSLIQSYEWWYLTGTTWTKSASTTISITPAIPTATSWRVVAIQYDGTRLTSNEVTVAVVPTATATMTVPAYCLAAIVPNTNNNVIVNPTLTATVSVAADVKQLTIQIKHSSASVWSTGSPVWTTKTTSFSTAATQFTVDGLWSVRAELIRTDDSVVYSNIAQMTCVKRTITATASDTSPDVGASTSLSAALSSTAPAGFVNTPLGWDYKNTGDWVDWNTTVNPRVWIPSSTLAHSFRWSESWPDGSKLYSNSVLISPTAPTSVKGTGGTNVTLQAVLDEGYTKKLPVVLTGTWTIDSRVYVPPGARVTATGAVFNSTTASQMFSNAGPQNQHDTTTGATGWSKGGNWIWDGGTFNAANQSSTAFSVVHCPSFTVKNATIYNTMAHGIEINSSGGLPNAKGVTAMADADFTVQILNNTFLGMDGARRSTDEDEAIHWDYAWTGGSTAGSGNDGTVCNNILIKDNVVKRTRTYSYPVAVGHHHSITDSAGGRALPDAPHKNIKIISNDFYDVVPVNAANERGTVHIHSGAKQVYINGNNFIRCTNPIAMEPRTLPSHWTDLAQSYWISGNTFNACGGSGWNYAWITGAAGGRGGAQWYNISVWNNLFTGAIPATTTTWLVFFQDTTSLSITSNKFWGLTGGGNSPKLSALDGNRIYGSPASPGAGVTGMTLDANTWCARADGVGAVEDNS